MEVLTGKAKFFLWGSIVAGVLAVPFVASAGIIRKPPTNLGLTGYWPMNEGRGTTITDHSGNGRNFKFGTGPTINPPTWGAGKRGGALNFSATNAYLAEMAPTFAASTIITAATGTISVWIRPSANSTVPGIIYDTPAVISDAAGYFGIHQGIVDGLDRLWAYNYDAEDDYVGVIYTPGEWVHITWMHASSTLYVYKNGELVGSTASANTGVLTNQMMIARNYSTEEFKGDIDEVRTYNRELSASEIKRLYETGSTKIGRTNKSPGTLADGLIGHWTFDGPDMVNNVTDRGSGGNPGYIVNPCGGVATTTTAGKLGQAFQFDACGKYINLGDPANESLDMGTSDFSVGFWVKFNSFPASKYFLSKGFATQRFYLYTLAGGRLRANIGDGTTAVASTNDGPIFQANQWYHVVVTFDRGGNMVRYLDGVQMGTADSIADVTGSISSSSDFEIGSVLGGSNTIDGIMDDVRLYNRVLSTGEITQLYRMGEQKVAKTTTPTDTLASGLVAHYTFDGKNMYNNVADVSGNGRNGALSGQAATSTTIGKIGQALNFDGTNDYVDLGDNAAFEPSGSTSFSVAFWYKGLKGSTEHFVSHSPSVATNYWFVDHDSAQFCGGTGCAQAKINSYTLPSDNGWHHLAVVLDRSTSPDQLKVYLDGVSIGTQSGALDGHTTTWATNTRIGAPYWASSGYRQGPMDDVRFYNRALSASEAKQLYLLGK